MTALPSKHSSKWPQRKRTYKGRHRQMKKTGKRDLEKMWTACRIYRYGCRTAQSMSMR